MIFLKCKLEHSYSPAGGPQALPLLLAQQDPAWRQQMLACGCIDCDSGLWSMTASRLKISVMIPVGQMVCCGLWSLPSPLHLRTCRQEQLNHKSGVWIWEPLESQAFSFYLTVTITGKAMVVQTWPGAWLCVYIQKGPNLGEGGWVARNKKKQRRNDREVFQSAGQEVPSQGEGLI